MLATNEADKQAIKGSFIGLLSLQKPSIGAIKTEPTEYPAIIRPSNVVGALPSVSW